METRDRVAHILPCPPPGVEMSAQILDIAQRYRPDFVLAHLFGRSPSVAIKGLKSSGYPASKVLGFVWASSRRPTSRRRPAGGVSRRATTRCSSPASAMTTLLSRTSRPCQKAGKPPPKEMETSVFYNRGILDAAVLY